MSRLRVTLWLSIFAAILLALRIAAPSDLNQNTDQVKTISFTADMVQNGRYILPYDQRGTPAMKPPLVNWLGLPTAWLGWWDEWSLKTPSILMGLGSIWICAWMTHWLARQPSEPSWPGPTLDKRPARDWFTGWGPIQPGYAAVSAGMLWIGSTAWTKHVYFARPDMTTTTLLLLAWAASTLVLWPKDETPVDEDTQSSSPTLSPGHWGWLLVFWGAMALAWLAKGPTALIPLPYVLLLAKWRHGRFLTIRRLRPLMGLPLSFAPMLLWLGLAYQLNPEHVVGELIKDQAAGRVAGNSGVGTYLLTIAKDVPEMMGWGVERLGPGFLVAVYALFFWRPSRWRHHPVGPAAIWMVCVFMFFLPVSQKGGSYIMPMLPSACVVAGLWLASRPSPRIGFLQAAVLAVLFAGSRVIYFFFFSGAATTTSGYVINDFAQDAKAIVGDDAVLFAEMQTNPIPTLLGRHPMTPIPEPGATWWVREVNVERAKDFRIGEEGVVLMTEPFTRRQGQGSNESQILVLRQVPAGLTPDPEPEVDDSWRDTIPQR